MTIDRNWDKLVRLSTQLNELQGFMQAWIILEQTKNRPDTTRPPDIVEQRKALLTISVALVEAEAIKKMNQLVKDWLA